MAVDLLFDFPKLRAPGMETAALRTTDPALTTTIAAPPNLLTSTWDKIDDWFTGRDADTSGMTASMAKTARQGTMAAHLGVMTSLLGGAASAIGSYYAARTAENQEKAQAANYGFQADMAAIDASRAETTAESITEAGKSRVADYTMRAGQQKAGATAAMAARGVALGVGSTRDVAASMDIEKDLNVDAMNANTTRQAWAAREQKANYRNESSLDRVSAANARASAGSVSAGSAVSNSLLGTATRVAGQWDWDGWLRRRMAAGAPPIAVPQLGRGVS